VDTRAGRDGICLSCLAHVVERKETDVRLWKRVKKSNAWLTGAPTLRSAPSTYLTTSSHHVTACQPFGQDLVEYSVVLYCNVTCRNSTHREDARSESCEVPLVTSPFHFYFTKGHYSNEEAKRAV
jgi:hypothetical protein